MSASKGRPRNEAPGADYDPLTISLGVLGRPHGTRGEIALRLFNVEGPAPARLDSVILQRAGQRQVRALTGVRPCANGLLVTFDGIDSREQAAALTQSQVRVPRQALPALGPGEYYVSDIVGCQVFTESGALLGLVGETFWNGAHDVMVVESGGGEAGGAGEGGEGGGDGGGESGGEAGSSAGERLIPLVPEFVRQVDTAGRKVRVAWDV